MRIESLTLRDIGPFVKETVKFEGNLIGIVGDNGTGKSTLVEGLYSAWTGDFRKFSNLAKFVRKLPGGGRASSGSIQSVGLHGVHRLTVRRTISVTREEGRQQAKLTITTPGHEDEVLTGPTAVDARLRELLGSDLKLLGKYAFVRQDKITAVVDALPSARTELLHKLFALDRFERVWDVLGRESTGLPDLQTADDPKLLDLECAKAEAEIGDLVGQERRLRSEIEALEPERLQSDLDAWEAQGSLRQRLTAAEALVQQAFEHAQQAASTEQEAVQAHQRLEGEVRGLAEIASAAEQFLAEAQNVRAAIAERDRQAAEAARVSAEWEALRPPAQPVERWTDAEEAELQRLRSLLHTSQQFLNEHSRLMDGGQALGRCPTCGQALVDIAKAIDEHRQRVADLRPQVERAGERATRLTNGLNAYTAGLAVFNSRVQTLESAAGRVNELFKQTVARLSGVDTAAYTDEAMAMRRQQTTAYAAARGRLETSAAQVQARVQAGREASARYQSRVAEEDSLRAELSRISAQVASLSTDRIDYCCKTLKLVSEKRVELAVSGQKLADRQQGLTNLRARLARAQAVCEQIERVRLTRELLLAARDVFHRDQLPMSLGRRYLALITAELRNFLELLHSDFIAELEQVGGEYQFRCMFADGIEQDASDLSGGEKARFSIGLILAINEALSSRLGVMAMDEPTAQLDENNVQSLAELLVFVKQYAASSGMQIFLITHASQLVGAFDQTIRLESRGLVSGDTDTAYEDEAVSV